MRFFTSSSDLGDWVRRRELGDSVGRILSVIGNDYEQDVVDLCKGIKRSRQTNEKTLFAMLSKFGITEIREANMNKNEKITKEAQAVMRTDGLYQNLPLRICPKLPKQSAGKQLISTYNCRTYCLDSLVLDEEPEKVYCLEAMWRRHVMDKFSREFKNKDGKWVGGYINERFQIFHSDGGNPMELTNDERTRQPRPHQWSAERRLEEQRKSNPKSITLNAEQVDKFFKTASKSEVKVFDMFRDSIEMREDGLSEEEIISNLSSHYETPIEKAAEVYYSSLSKMQSHSRNKTIYAFESNKTMIKTAQNNTQINFMPNSTYVTARDVDVVSNGQPVKLRANTPVVVVSNNGTPTFQITDGDDAGSNFVMTNNIDLSADTFSPMEDIAGDIQDSAMEVGLTEDIDTELMNTME